MSRRTLRILVYPHAMEVGGSQLNAVELAGAVRDLGHDVTVVSDDGPLVRLVHDLGLPHVSLPQQRRRPSPLVVRKLRRLVRERGIDIIHGYEWPPGLDAAAAAFLSGRAAAVCTIMSMAVAPFLPRFMPLVVGTEALRDRTRADRSGPVYLIEPPVDVELNAPGHPVDEFRTSHGLRDEPGDERTVDIAIICRLVRELKLEGLLTAIDVVADLAAEYPVRLVIAGDGSARDLVEERAAKANARAGRRAIVLTGQLLDPRSAYAAADIVLGMGGSALRALAFERPLVVQGEDGFWELLTPDSCDLFLRQGWYGVGSGPGGAERLAAILRELVRDPQRRAALGAYGRRLAVERFSLQRAAAMQEEIYREALDAGGSAWWVARQVADGARSAAGVAVHKVRQRYRQVRGTRATDDFNQVTLAADALRPENRPAPTR